MSLLQQDEDILFRCYNKMRISFVVVTTRYNKMRISLVVVTTRSEYRLSLLQQEGYPISLLQQDIVCRCYNKIKISLVVVTRR